MKRLPIKNSFLLSLFCAFYFTASAQQKTFLKDENSKFIYYQVLETAGKSRASLMSIAKKYVSENHRYLLKLKANTDSSLLANGVIMDNRALTSVGHLTGAVNYQLHIEAKEGKLRFWFDHFTHVPYHRDRYGNFVPTTSYEAPLEKQVTPLNNFAWREIQTNTLNLIKEIDADFRKTLSENDTRPHEEKTIKKVIKTDW